MAYEDRSYSGSAVPTTLTANISNVATTIPIASSSGWPDGTSGPFHVAIAPASDPDNFVEVIRCTGRTGLNLNVQTTPVNGRGWDGTTAAAHLVGAIIRHVFTATDADEANQHISNTGLDHHTQYLTVVRHDTPTRHGIASLPVGGTPSSSLVGDTAQAGTSSTLARSDHKHSREGFGSPVQAGATNADGTAITLPRSDHRHAGGIPITTSGLRPGSPITGETIIESDTLRKVGWSGTRWQRNTWLGATGRTGFVAQRTTPYTIPDAGPSSYLLPWSTEVRDSDNYSPPADGTTTFTATVGTDEARGLYFITLIATWGAVITQRTYIEIVHGDGAGGLAQYRGITTGDDRGHVGTLLDLGLNHFVQVGAWQNSGASQDITSFQLQMYRIGP